MDWFGNNEIMKRRERTLKLHYADYKTFFYVM